MYKIEIFKNKDNNIKALFINGEFALFYEIRDNGGLTINRINKGFGNIKDFEPMNYFFVSHVNNLCDVIREGEAICLA